MYKLKKPVWHENKRMDIWLPYQKVFAGSYWNQMDVSAR